MITDYHKALDILSEKKVIAFSGLKGSGKTTLARAISGHLDAPIFSFAWPMKRILAEQAGISMDFFTNQSLKQKPLPGTDKTPRVMMQTFGTEFIRHIDPDFWATYLLMEVTHSSGEIILIDDLRMKNEAKMLREYTDCLTIYVNRISDDDDHHASEQESKNILFDFVVDNNSTIDIMVNKTKQYLSTREL